MRGPTLRDYRFLSIEDDMRKTQDAEVSALFFAEFSNDKQSLTG